MKIINTIDKRVEFVSIKVGDCFLYDNCLFVKMNPIKANTEHSPNAFCFIDNYVAYFEPGWNVTPVNAEIIIHSKGVE